MIDKALLLRFLDIEVLLVDDGPASSRDQPERGNAFVVVEMVSLGHILISEIDFDVWVLRGGC